MSRKRKRNKTRVSSRNSRRKKRLKKRKGWLPLPSDSADVTGSLHSCMQDAVLNAGAALGADIDKAVLYKEVPPRRTIGTSLHEVFQAPSVSSALRFADESHETLNSKGGPEYALVRNDDGHVRVVTAQVEGSGVTQHAFVFCSSAAAAHHPTGQGGLLIDNRVGRSLVQDSDRASKESARIMLKEFFGIKGDGGGVFVQGVYRITIADSGERD